MAKTRTLPDKYYDKDYETNGIHRVPLWRIAGFALNNTATNLYLMFMNYVSFYLLGFLPVLAAVLSLLYLPWYRAERHQRMLCARNQVAV